MILVPNIFEKVPYRVPDALRSVPNVLKKYLIGFRNPLFLVPNFLKVPYRVPDVPKKIPIFDKG